MAPVIPRSREHFTSIVAYIEDVEDLDADDYFTILTGVYNAESYGCGDCCYGPLNSDECSSMVATDGGRWWLTDTEYYEPNGDFDGGCFLYTCECS